MSEVKGFKVFNPDWTYRKWLDSDARYLLNRIDKNVVEWIYESECGQIWWDGLREYNRDIIRALPNFDAEIFEQVTGIKVN